MLTVCSVCYIAELLTVNNSTPSSRAALLFIRLWDPGCDCHCWTGDSDRDSALYGGLDTTEICPVRICSEHGTIVSANHRTEIFVIILYRQTPHPLPTLPSSWRLYPFLCHLTFYRRNFTEQFHPDWFYGRKILVTSLTRRHLTSALMRQDTEMVRCSGWLEVIRSASV